MFDLLSKHWIMTVIGVAILSAAICGVIYGVLTRGRWVDRGLMERDGKRLKWPPDSLPITIYWDPLLAQGWRDAFARAAMRYSSAIDRRLFFPITDPPAGYQLERPPPYSVVCFRSEESELDDKALETVQAGGAVTQHRYRPESGEITAASVTLPNVTESAFCDSIVLHELGHVMGLDHDEQNNSIMFPAIHGRPQELTDSDVRLLREVYG